MTACSRFLVRSAVIALLCGMNGIPCLAQGVHVLRYSRPAEDSISGWERQSLPLGCSHFGANVFGGAIDERIQITHNAVLTERNLTDALDIRLRQSTWGMAADAYDRGLELETGTAWVEFDSWDGRYRREYFASYPDRTLAVKLTSAGRKAITFELRAEIPFGRPGTVTVKDGHIHVDYVLEPYGVKFAGRLAVTAEGAPVVVSGSSLVVSNAESAVVYFTCETNYRLSPGVFSRPNAEKLADCPEPGSIADANLASVLACDYCALRKRHLEDMSSMMDRAAIDLDASDGDRLIPTDALIAAYRLGRRSRYLEETYWQYGRYLLVASSRPGGLPANLQGVWTGHKKSPWGSGYWHNINVQMNYWPAFNSNLAECFIPYAEFNAAFRPCTRELVIGYLKAHGLGPVPSDGEAPDIWCVGTSVYPYIVCGGPGSHSGPGTVGLTTKCFADWYDYTLDEAALKKYVWPVIHGAADFLERCVVETNGFYLSKFSASPEQMVGHLEDHFRWGIDKAQYYVTTGCAFDQQMIWENNHDLLRFAKKLGIDDSVVKLAREQLGKYDPVQIGASGQIKEFREEVNYSDIGQSHHRHISQLVGLMPGTLITREKPEWLAAARKTLDFRGDESTGWALAHRLNARARTGEGNRAYLLLGNLLRKRTFDNLWDAHPPFQIDGNFGATAGVTEMLIQSHAGYIDLLPALPDEWAKHGSFRGLRARGAFEVDCEWRDGRPVSVRVRSLRGGRPDVRFNGKPWRDFHAE